uniref:Uncharacterized protein n=1 Tax=Romanomermis culicivorax TaxID=13658 RepID=A0A915KIR7_ROMCU
MRIKNGKSNRIWNLYAAIRNQVANFRFSFR